MEKKEKLCWCKGRVPAEPRTSQRSTKPSVKDHKPKRQMTKYPKKKLGTTKNGYITTRYGITNGFRKGPRGKVKGLLQIQISRLTSRPRRCGKTKSTLRLAKQKSLNAKGLKSKQAQFGLKSLKVRAKQQKANEIVKSDI